MDERKKIILDVDTGSDDAVAITCALLSSACDVLGICTVGGNLPLANVTDNTLRVVQCCGREDVGVYVGSASPLASTLVPWGLQAELLCRKEGVRELTLDFHPEHLPLPAPRITARPQCATVWLIETLLAAEDHSITLVPVGPITNIAIALKADPRIIPKIREIVMMGGSDRVIDPTQAAEFNVWCDPEALEIVLQSGAPVTMVPFDATVFAALTREQAAEIRQVGTSPAQLIADLIDQRLDASVDFEAVHGLSTGEPIHDALAICAALHPEVLTDVRQVSCHVDLGRGYCYGETVIDRNYKYDAPQEKNCRFAYGADNEFFFQWILSVLKAAR
ncbi:nucleoside hydrolase [Neobittarella massiliensis]|uniref:Pyrimidine-specific ribonucleoside hydrolase rihB n=1 Tax=uncultured Anaerotruncus sp. TaxID=905011 RepID=A0A1C6FMB1_9FIRM|nr:nucleoside hydrolase [Neobittarella massiliensis]SCJ33934.1 Pyrimidine-specific ribonucleoside hydrolase rihB [uncultured Anaerotruncus sp.]